MICNIKRITAVDSKIDSIFSELSFLRTEYPEFYSWFYDKVIPELSNGTRSIYLAKSFGEIKGILILKDTVEEKKICTLYVDESSRSNRIGSKLMEIAMNEFHGGKPLITVADSHIEDFRHLLAKYDFKEEDSLPDYYTDGRIEYTFNGHLYLPENVKYA